MLTTFARMLGIPIDAAEDALHSERTALAVLGRRSFFVGTALLATGAAFSFAPHAPLLRLPDAHEDGALISRLHNRAEARLYLYRRDSEMSADGETVVMPKSSIGRWHRVLPGDDIGRGYKFTGAVAREVSGGGLLGQRCAIFSYGFTDARVRFEERLDISATLL